MSLYEHEKHEHIPRNVNKQEHIGFNGKIAVAITRALGSMWAAYVFSILALIGFPGFSATPTQYVQWVSQTFIQLVALSVLAVGQSILGRKQSLQADEQYKTTTKTYHDTEQMTKHMRAQDAELLRQTQLINDLKSEVVHQTTNVFFKMEDQAQLINNLSAKIDQFLSKPVHTSRKKPATQKVEAPAG